MTGRWEKEENKFTLQVKHTMKKRNSPDEDSIPTEEKSRYTFNLLLLLLSFFFLLSSPYFLLSISLQRKSQEKERKWKRERDNRSAYFGWREAEPQKKQVGKSRSTTRSISKILYFSFSLASLVADRSLVLKERNSLQEELHQVLAYLVSLFFLSKNVSSCVLNVRTSCISLSLSLSFSCWWWSRENFALFIHPLLSCHTFQAKITSSPKWKRDAEKDKWSFPWAFSSGLSYSVIRLRAYDPKDVPDVHKSH